MALRDADGWIEYLARIRPYSLTALSIAIAAVAAATLLRIVVGWFGVTAPFSTYFPAVLVSALIGGVPAGIASMVASAIIVWLAFVPPPYDFNTLGATDIANFSIFFISGGLIVFFAHLNRVALRELQRRHRERELLMRELQHRGRNTYAVVEGIVRTTLTGDRDKADAIAARVRAVSSANDLVNWSHDLTVQLSALLHLIFGANAQRISILGPGVELSSQAARTLGLVFHELMTNAIKHGALSTPEGRIEIRWTHQDGKVHLSWREIGGPPVAQPSRTGFGTTIVSHSLDALSGSIDLAFEPGGLRCDIKFAPK